MERDRVNYKIFQWSVNINKKNWCYKVKDKLRECNFYNFIDTENVLSRRDVSNLENLIFEKYISEWESRSID